MPALHFEDTILFENDNYLFINKPAHIATLDERTSASRSILQMARAYFPDVQIGHRLDKETTGVLAIAKNPEAYRHLAIQFERREVKKIYHAVVSGLHEFKDEEVTLPLLPLPNGIVKIDRHGGKEAATFFTTLRIFKKHTLVECEPITGRMHQIRVHLSALKAPIVFDTQYGGEELYLSSIKRKFNLKKDTEELPLIRRVALHAYSLTFRQPNEELLHVVAPYPKDFDVLVKQLEKNV